VAGVPNIFAVVGLCGMLITALGGHRTRLHCCVFVNTVYDCHLCDALERDLVKATKGVVAHSEPPGPATVSLYDFQTFDL